MIMLNRIKVIYDKYSKIGYSAMDYDQFLKFDRARTILENSIEEHKQFGKLSRVDRHILEIEYENYNRRFLERKEAKKKRFETKIFYEPLFYSTSLNADYGTFVCSECGYTFYHSPSAIYQGRKLISANTCGNCTNKFLKADIFQ